MSEKELEAEIQAKGLNAPRLTPELVDTQILSQDFYVFPGTTCTVCCLTLQNGYHVIGKSSPVSAENFDSEVGRKAAFKNAREQIWGLEGYRLREKFANLGR